ncbi:MAG: GerMN domain-containing protein [Patescibacteria group bacterium]|nr:GerMN domain-containing protein [Patescibacteria group bacterium]
MKKSTSFFLGLFAFALITAGVMNFWQSSQEAEKTTPPTNDELALPSHENIELFSPSAYATISSPVSLSGQARGFWYFEADFPIEITDANNNVLGQGIATAQSDWMTENFVPFTASISFSPSPTATGFIVLHKDNPSGLPEHDDQFQVPINFSLVEQISLLVFFPKEGDNLDCSEVFPIEFAIPKTLEVGRAALDRLLAGPSIQAQAQGYFSSLPENVTLNSLVIENGVAYADFNEALDQNVGGSCRVTSIRSQIENTLEQFASVDQVVISINGESEEILQP